MPRTSTRHFGIEFEFTRGGRSIEHWAQVLRPILPDLRVRNQSCVNSNGLTWDLKVDGSCGYELTSPKLTWADWPTVERALDALLAAGARTSRSCGLHVHHDVRDYSEGDMKALLSLWALHEGTLFALLPPSRYDNTYAIRMGFVANTVRSLTADEAARSFRALDAQFRRGIGNVARWRGSKYEAMSLRYFWSRGTVEVRAANGTLRHKDAATWVEVTQGLVERALGAPEMTEARWVRTVTASRPMRVKALVEAARGLTPVRDATVRALATRVRGLIQRRRPNWIAEG